MDSKKRVKALDSKTARLKAERHQGFKDALDKKLWGWR